MTSRFLILALAARAAAGGLQYRISLDPADAVFTGAPRSVAVSMPGLELAGDPGTPLLPALPITLVLPAGSWDVTFEAVPLSRHDFEGAIHIGPAPVLRPLDQPVPSRQITFEDEGVYGSDSPWPRSIILSSHVGRLAGFTVASCLVQPWSFVPSGGRLSLFTGIDLRVSWSEGAPPVITGLQAASAVRRLGVLVDNPEQIQSCMPAIRPSGPGDAEWVVICDSSMTDSFDPLLEHWQAGGMSAAALTIQDILAAQPGSDPPEQLRHAIDSLVSEEGTLYVLLAGDETIIPVRMVFSECEGFLDVEVPCDYYYSDLDGTWDGNGDGSYGQPDDGLDLYIDVLLGRAPIATEEDAGIFVSKTLTYLEDPPGGEWANTALLCGAMLFPDVGYTGGKGCDTLAAELPASWDVVKIYESPVSTDGTDTQIAFLNEGTGWNYFSGHGNNRGIYWYWMPQMMMTRMIAEAMTNGSRTGIHTSIACHPGDFTDGNSCVEALFKNPDGGAVSVTFNTGVGWEGFWPELGVSEWLCILYTRSVFVQHAPTLGEAFASAKDQRVPLMHGGYDRNLQALLCWTAFHDPALVPLAVPPDTPIPPQPLALGAPWPNPVWRGAPITFQVLYTTGQAHVAVYDIAGRLMWSTTTGGPGTLQWDGNQPSGDRAPAGVYIVTARRGDYGVSRLVTILD